MPSQELDLDRPDSYVALGDSFTEGLDDARPDGAFRGWADLVAVELARSTPGFRYANLAVRGRRLVHVWEDQLPQAEAMRPALVSVAIGGNDITGRTCDVPALGRRFHDVLERLVATQARVVTFAGFDTRPLIPFSRMVSERAAEYNDCIRQSSLALGATLVDLWHLPRIYEPAQWGPDRLHMSTTGHLLVARAVLDALGHDAAGLPEVAPEPAVEPAWSIRRMQDVRWAGEHVAPWLWRAARGRSSGDGLSPKRPALEPVSPAATAGMPRAPG